MEGTQFRPLKPMASCLQVHKLQVPASRLLVKVVGVPVKTSLRFNAVFVYNCEFHLLLFLVPIVRLKTPMIPTVGLL